MAIFGVAAIGICVATICVARMAIESRRAGGLNLAWMGLWGVVESTVGECRWDFPIKNAPDSVSAVIVGCLPTFGLLLPPVASTSQPRYGSRTKKCFQDFDEASAPTSRENAYHMQPYQAKNPMKRFASDSQTRVCMVSADESGERLEPPTPGVMVTNTFEVCPCKPS